MSLLDYQKLGAPHNGTPTSIVAAVAAGRKMGTRKQAVLASLRCWPEYGQTQDELSIALDLPRSTIASVCNALEKDGHVRKTNDTRPSRYGGSCVVYEAVPSNRRHMEMEIRR